MVAQNEQEGRRRLGRNAAVRCGFAPLSKTVTLHTASIPPLLLLQKAVLSIGQSQPNACSSCMGVWTNVDSAQPK